jgi:tetratricopeptide (TPR) repeat protein
MKNYGAGCAFFVLLIIPSCAGLPRLASDSPRIAVEHLDPAAALRVLRESPRAYEIRSGMLRRDSLAQQFTGAKLVPIEELSEELGELWDRATAEMLAGNPKQAAELFRSVVEVSPACADCRAEFARALFEVARTPKQPAAKASNLRSEARDQLLIAGILDPQTPAGRGLFWDPSQVGRTDIPLAPGTRRGAELFAAGNDAFNSQDVAQARSFFAALVATEPNFGRGNVALGDTYVEEGNFREAARWYAQALQADSTDYVAWRSLSECFLVEGNLSGAREAATWAAISNYQDPGFPLIEGVWKNGWNFGKCRAARFASFSTQRGVVLRARRGFLMLRCEPCGVTKGGSQPDSNGIRLISRHSTRRWKPPQESP